MMDLFDRVVKIQNMVWSVTEFFGKPGLQDDDMPPIQSRDKKKARLIPE